MARRTKGTNIELFNRLRDQLGPKKVSRSLLDQVSYSRDMWPLAKLWARHGEVKHRPDFVVWPETTEEVSRLLRMCQETGYPVIPYGAGSGVCGGAIPVEGGIICDMKRMNRVDAINDKSLLVTAQTGILGEHLERHLAHHGYTLGHFPGSIYCSTLGGYLSTRSAGQMSSKYGKIEDMVISLQVVLPNGDIVHTRSSPRSATGPNFNQLFMGAEGTLGIITRATLRVRLAPEGREYSSFAFRDLASATEAMRKIMQRGLSPAVVRLYDQTAMASFFSSLKLPSNATGCLLILMFEGWPRRCALEQNMAAETCLSQGGIQLGEEPAREWWDRRYADSYRQSRVLVEENTVIDTVEMATTWSNLLSLHGAVKASLERHVAVAATFAHAYRGGCSIGFEVIGKAEEIPDTQLYQNFWKDALDACIRTGGTISHHQGVGILKAEWMKRQMAEWLKVYAGLKRRMDPENTLNPHKMGLP